MLKNDNQLNLESNYKKMYYETDTSTQKILPYHVRFESAEQASHATDLLDKLGFEKIAIPNTKSFNIYVNFKLRRYCHPQVSLWHLGCKDYLDYEQFKAVLQEFLQSFNIDSDEI